MVQHPAAVLGWSGITQVALGQTAGPVPHRQVVLVGLLLLRLSQGAEQGLHVLVQCLWMVQTLWASLPACITCLSWQVSPVTSAPLIHPEGTHGMR